MLESSDVEFPEFLNADYLEALLMKFREDQTLKIRKVVVKSFGGVGDAFASKMYHVEVEVTRENKCEVDRENFIVKMMPTSQMARDKLGHESYDVQRKEMKIFQDIFPEFIKILEPIGEHGNIFPNAIAVDKSKEVLLLENLADRNFIMADRKVGLDLDHLKLALAKLAKFHAASMVMLDEKPERFSNYDIGYFSRKTSSFDDFFRTNMDALTAEVSSWEGFEKYAEKLEALKSKLMGNAYKVFDNDGSDLKVLVHGDLWVNNLMFKYGIDGKPKDAILLDFQFCCIAHPAIDVLYFVYTSAIDNVRQSNISELIQFYFYELKRVLMKLNYDPTRIPSLHQLKVQAMRKYFYAFPSTMVILPLMIANDPESSFENFHPTDETALAFKRRLYKNPDLQKIIRNSLPTFDRLGLLDEM